MKKIVLAVLWIVALVALLMLCWLLTLDMRWPTWAISVLFAGVLVAFWLAGQLRRWWRNAALRRRIAPAIARATPDRASIDTAFKRGLAALRRSRLGRFGALYGLPWVLLLGDSGSGKSTLLVRSRLTSAMRVVNAQSAVNPTNTLDWWFLEHAVVLDPAGRLFEADADAPSGVQWQRLLTRLARSRRREPLNAVVLTIAVHKLMPRDGAAHADLDALGEEGQRARLKLDELYRVFEARIPVYLMLTHTDCLPGFTEWMERVAAQSGATSQMAPGAVLPVSLEADEFLSQAFAVLNGKLGALRLAAGKAYVNAGESLFVPELIASLEAALRAYVLPAFRPGPYSAAPLLRGLFLSADVPQVEPSHHFARALFERVIPADRDLWQPTAGLGVWRRLLTHGVLIAWLVLCCALAGLTVFSYFDARQMLATLAEDRRPTSDFSNGFGGRLVSLTRDAQTVQWLDEHIDAWRYRWLPYTLDLRRTSERLRANFAGDFHDHVLVNGVDAAVTARIHQVSLQGQDALVASYADLLVRRIVLLDAALAGKPLDGLPLPGDTLAPILADAYPDARYDPAAQARFGPLYRDYVRWQPSASVLQAERETLRQQLGILALANRSRHWLVSWADFHGDLEPVRAADLWRIPDRPELPRLSAAYTGRGRDAILSFIDSLASASGNDTIWQQRRLDFEAGYQSDQQAAWYEFITAFPRTRDVLDGQDQWRAVLARLSHNGGPYYRLLHTAAVSLGRTQDKDARGTVQASAAQESGEADQSSSVASGQVVAAPGTPPWVDLTIRLDRLLTAPVTAASDASPSLKPLTWLREANSVGQAVVRGQGDMAGRYAGAKSDFALVGQLVEYKSALSSALNDIVKGSGAAYAQAANTYSFAKDPGIKRAPLIDAQNAFNRISAVEPATEVWPVWALVRGPLDFTLDFISRSAACTLQDDWNAQVLAPLQGASSAADRDQLLFSSNGLIPSFMTGPAKPFIDRNVTRYKPREVLEQRVPLNGIFYQYVSRAQVLRNALTSESEGAQRRQQEDASAARAREAEIQALSTQIATLQARARQLEGTTAVVGLAAQPVQVTPGATQTVQSATLSLRCAGGTTDLVNYNFPVSQNFNWSFNSCGDTTLTVQFAQSTLIKRWPGPRGFVDFLRASRDGRIRLDLANYPQSAPLLASSGVKDVTVIYSQTGQAALLSAFDELDRVQAQLNTLSDRRQTLQARAAGSASGGLSASGDVPLPGADAMPPAGLPPLPALVDETSAQLSLPRVIGQCWQPDALDKTDDASTAGQDDALNANAAAVVTRDRDRSAATKAGKKQPADSGGGWAVQVGIFADPDLADSMLAKLGYHSVRERFRLPQSEENTWLVRVQGFESRQKAQDAALRINQALGLQSLIEHPRADEARAQ